MELSPDYNDKLGNRAIEIQKRINGVAVVATIERGENKEFIVTSWKYKKSDALDASKETPGLYVRNDSDIAKVKKDIENIKASASNASKIVDSIGEPKVVRHNTDNEFTIFDNRFNDIRFRSIGGNVIVRIVGRIKKGLNYISPSKSSLITSLRVLPIRSA